MSNAAGRPRKENYYIQIKNADSSALFVDVSNQLGKPLEISKPLATALMRVRDDQVLFSVLKMYKRALEKLKSEPLNFKPGPLARLERSAKTLLDARTEPLPADRLIVLIDDVAHEVALKRDAAGVVSLEYDVDATDPVMELPKSPLQMTLFLTSPRTNRLIVVGWQGYQGKPGDHATVTQVAAQALFHLVGLTAFQLLSGIESVRVPAPAGRYQVVAPTRKASDRVEFTVPVRLWTEDSSAGAVGAGNVLVNIDLDNANTSATGDVSKLLFHMEPDAALGEPFEAYRGVFHRAVAGAFNDHFGHDELFDLACNIVLSDVSEGDLGRLRDAAATITGFELSPRQHMTFTPSV